MSLKNSFSIPFKSKEWKTRTSLPRTPWRTSRRGSSSPRAFFSVKYFLLLLFVFEEKCRASVIKDDEHKVKNEMTRKWMLILCLQNRSSIIEYYSLFLSFFRTQLSRTKKIVCDSMFVRILAQFLYSFAAHLNLKFECMLKKSFSFSFLDLVSANPRFHSLLFLLLFFALF